MLTSVHKAGGRGYKVAAWAIGLMTVVALVCLWRINEADSLARVISSYMLGASGIGAASQGRNFANALPGQRVAQETRTRDDAP